jgi:predicted ATPase
MGSALWAGKRQAKKPARIKLLVGLAPRSAAAAGDSEPPPYTYEISTGLVHSYEIDIGVRPPTAAAFIPEPQIKEEMRVFRHGKRQIKLLERRGPAVFARDADDQRTELGLDLMASETALGSLDDPARFPDLYLIRRAMLDWRFYHGFRTDSLAPLRHPCLAVTTPTLSSDANDLAAVFATLVHIREDTRDLDRAIDDAFPGAELVVPAPGRTASFGMTRGIF